MKTLQEKREELEDRAELAEARVAELEKALTIGIKHFYVLDGYGDGYGSGYGGAIDGDNEKDCISHFIKEMGQE